MGLGVAVGVRVTVGVAVGVAVRVGVKVGNEADRAPNFTSTLMLAKTRALWSSSVVRMYSDGDWALAL